MVLTSYIPGCCPPSIVISVPVIYCMISETSNSVIYTISFGPTKFLNGIAALTLAFSSSIVVPFILAFWTANLSARSVDVAPGEIAFT